MDNKIFYAKSRSLTGCYNRTKYKKIKEIKHIDFNTRPNIQNDVKEKKKTNKNKKVK